MERDVFYVFASDYKSSTPPCKKSVWRVDMRCFQLDEVNDEVLEPTKASLIAKVSSAGLLHGMTELGATHILGADSMDGNVIRIAVEPSTSLVTINETSMKTTPDGIGVRINGIDIHDKLLYFTSLGQHLFAREPIVWSRFANGPIEDFANLTGSADNFAFSRDGKRAWTAINGVQGERHILLEVDINTERMDMISNSTLLDSRSVVARVPGGQGASYITEAASLGNRTTDEGVMRADQLCYA